MVEKILLNLAGLALSQGKSTGGDAGAIVLWGSLIILVIVVGGLVVFQLRKRLLENENTAAEDPFGLQELRNLRKSGQISEQEYQTLRSNVIAQVKGAMPDDPADTPVDALRRRKSPPGNTNDEKDGFGRADS